jgi:hypothetical protein
MNQVFSHTSRRITRCVHAIAFVVSTFVSMTAGGIHVQAESSVDSNANAHKAMSVIRQETASAPVAQRMMIKLSEHDAQALHHIVQQTEREANAVQGEFTLSILTATDGSVEAVNFAVANDATDMLSAISSVCKRLQSCRFTPTEVNGSAVSGMVQVRVKMLK